MYSLSHSRRIAQSDPLITEPTIEEMQKRVEGMASAHRLLAFPLLLALHRLGGSAQRKDAIAEIARLVNGRMPVGSFEELRKRGRLGFTRAELKRRGFIAPGTEAGTWSLTAEAKAQRAP